MSKYLAILQELGKALDIPNDKLNALIENKKDEDIDQDALATLFKEGHRTKLDAISRNSAFDKKKVQEEAYRTAERKLKTDLENMLKQNFELPDSQAENLEALVDEIKGKQAKTPGKKSELTDDDIKKHPLFVGLEKKYSTDMAAEKKKGEDAVKAVKDEYAYEKTFSEVSTDALKVFEGLNPVLSADANKATSQRELVKRLLSDGYKYQKVDGQTIVLKADGTVLEDEFRNKVKFDDHVKKLTDPYFDFKKASDRQAPNGSDAGKTPAGEGGAKTMKYTGALPKSKQEVVDMVSNTTIPLEHRLEIQEWAEANTAQLAQ